MLTPIKATFRPNGSVEQILRNNLYDLFATTNVLVYAYLLKIQIQHRRLVEKLQPYLLQRKMIFTSLQ